MTAACVSIPRVFFVTVSTMLMTHPIGVPRPVLATLLFFTRCSHTMRNAPWTILTKRTRSRLGRAERKSPKESQREHLAKSLKGKLEAALAERSEKGHGESHRLGGDSDALIIGVLTGTSRRIWINVLRCSSRVPFRQLRALALYHFFSRCPRLNTSDRTSVQFPHQLPNERRHSQN
jgi:hypothetical protein